MTVVLGKPEVGSRPFSDLLVLVSRHKSHLVPWLCRLPLSALAVTAGVLALAVRAVNLYRAHDIFIDELSYSRIGESILHGAQPELYHRPFFLHPPLFFDVESLWLRVFGTNHSIVDTIYELRWLEILCAGITAALIVMITATVVSRSAALAAGALFIVDPLSVRVNTLVMLETPVVMFTLAGCFVIVSALKRGSGISVRRAIAAGILLGFAMSTKELAGLIIIPSLALTPFLGTGVTKRAAGYIVAIVVGTYCAIVAIGLGFTGEWFDVKLRGVSRLSGATQISGFNQVGAPSLTSSVLSQLLHFGVSITVLLGGALAIALCVWKARGGARFLAVIGLFSGLALAYAIAFGTLEEQQSYFFIVPAIMALVAVVWVLPAGIPKRGVAVRRIVAALGACALAGGAVATVVALTNRDDSYSRLAAYVNDNLPARSPVAATTETAAFVIPRMVAGEWGSPAEIIAHKAKFVITSSKQDLRGYSRSSADLPQWLSDHAHVVFSVTGTSNGVLTLWKIDGLPSSTG